MANANLEALAEKLCIFGLSKFVTEEYDYLYSKTAHLKNFGRELLKQRILINESELETCMSPAGDSDKNEKFYKVIVTKDDPGSFLLALQNSNNGHIIDFISKQLQQISTSSLASSVSTRLSAHLKEIKSSESGEPTFYTFSRSFAVPLYDGTDYNDKLLSLLIQEEVISTETANEIRLIHPTDPLGRGCKLYDIIKTKEISCIPKFVKALEGSANTPVIQLLDSELKKEEK